MNFTMPTNKLTPSDILLIAVNLLPVAGVWFWGWSAVEAFIVYALETLIIGIITIFKLAVASFAKGNNEWPANGKVTRQSGIFFILFFIAHFGIFAAVQTAIFSQSAKITPPGSGMFHFFFNWYTYINKDIALMLLAFVISNLVRTFIPFIRNEQYKTTPMILLMFQPYGRIVIQQFTVILGSMFLQFGLDKIFILIFVVIRIFFELFVNYEKLLSRSMEQLKKKSGD
jgi:hypothetical protein